MATSPRFAEYFIGDRDQLAGRERRVPPLRSPSATLGVAPVGMTEVGIASLALHKFPEHFLGINRNENSPAAGEDFTLLVQDFGFVDVLAAVDAYFPALHVKRLVQWHWLQILHRHFFR